MLVSPIPRPSAHIQEVICAGVAPSAEAAWNTIATELLYPTSTATKPATMADKERSRQKERSDPAAVRPLMAAASAVRRRPPRTPAQPRLPLDQAAAVA